MAIAAWKRIEKSPGYQRAKTSLGRLIGSELRLRVEIRLETIEAGGWWFTDQGLDQDSIVYSLGVGDDIAFDLSIIDCFGARVHAYDPMLTLLIVVIAFGIDQVLFTFALLW